jgi:hypothetical protein
LNRRFFALSPVASWLHWHVDSSMTGIATVKRQFTKWNQNSSQSGGL